MAISKIVLAGTILAAGVSVTPSNAATSIFVQASASGATGGLYSVGVRYFSPFGLTTFDSGSPTGTTSGVSPSSAATGLTAISLAAAVNGTRASGSSTASADISTGTVKATANSDTFLSGGAGSAEFAEDVTFFVAGGGSRQITVVSHLNGTIGAFANSFSVSGLSYILNFGTTSNIVYSSLGSQSGFTFSAGGASSPIPMGWDSYSLSNVTSTGFDFVGLLTISDGETRTVQQRLNLNCQEGVNCDYGHTGSIDLRLPSGVSFSSRSGVFLKPAPVSSVPEPATWAMLLMGFGFLGSRLRRRRALAIA